MIDLKQLTLQVKIVDSKWEAGMEWFNNKSKARHTETQKLLWEKESQVEFHLKTKNNYKRELHQANQMQEEVFKEVITLIEPTTNSLWQVNNLLIRLSINHRAAIYTTQLIIIIEIIMPWQIVLQLWDLVEIKVKANHPCPLKMGRKSLRCLQFSINLRQI